MRLPLALLLVAAGCDAGPGHSAAELKAATGRFRVDVLFFSEIQTCFVGDACTSGNCVGLRDDAQTLVAAFQDNASFRFVRPDDPLVGSAQLSRCVRLGLDRATQRALQEQVQQYRDHVFLWTGGAIDLRVHYHRVPPIALALSRFGGGPWVSPFDIAPLAGRYLSPRTDFTIVTPGIRDLDSGLHHDLGGCGGTFGADFGLAGAAYSWVPQSGGSFFFECANEAVYTHEWLHQVHFALNNLSGFDDLYHGVYPPCGQGDPDTTRWFPDTHHCLIDPDIDTCGTSACGDGDSVSMHVLTAHWSPDRVLIANHCRDGVQDFGETGIDVGGNCL